MVNKNRTQYQLGKNLRTKSCTPHRIKIKDGVVCNIGITTDGNVTLDDDGSWDDVDNSSIGNLKEYSLRYLIERHNDQCLLTCTESLMLDMAEQINVATADEMPFDTKIMNIFTLELAQSILEIRQELKKKYKMIPAYVIIDVVHMPQNCFGLAEYVKDMADANKNQDLQDLSEALDDDLFNGLITYLEAAAPDKSRQIVMVAKAIDYIRRNGDNFIKNKFAKYIDLLKYDERMYCRTIINGGTLPDNNKCYTCLDDGGDVFQDYDPYGWLYQ